METKTTYPKLARAPMYDVPYDCANCGWGGKQRFDMGEAAPQTVKCPKCGCRTAKKSVAPPYAPRRLDEREYPPLPWSPGPEQPWWPKRPLCDITARGERRWSTPYCIVG